MNSLHILAESGGGLVFIPIIIGGLIGIAVLAFWIWTLVDCIKNESAEGNDKIVWVLVIALAGWLGALIYILARRPTRIRELGQ